MKINFSKKTLKFTFYLLLFHLLKIYILQDQISERFAKMMPKKPKKHLLQKLRTNNLNAWKASQETAKNSFSQSKERIKQLKKNLKQQAEPWLYFQRRNKQHFIEFYYWGSHRGKLPLVEKWVKKLSKRGNNLS